MRFTNTFRVSLRALRRNTMRSILTALGIIIGVAAVITMVSIGNGAKAMVEAQVAALGQNLITVMPGSFSSGGTRGGYGSSTSLTPEDADAILADEPTGNLDSRTSIEIMGVFQKLNEQGITIVMVTHELDVAHYCKRNLILRDGVVVRDAPVENRSIAAEEMKRLKQAETAAKLTTAAHA